MKKENEMIQSIKKLDKSQFHVVKVSEDTAVTEIVNLSDYLDDNEIKHIILRDNVNIKEIPAKDKRELLDYIKREIGLKEDEESNILKVHKNGTVEVNINTITEKKLQYNDLRIQYLPISNIIVIDYDYPSSSVFYSCKVIEKGKTVRFKVKSEFGNISTFPGLKIFDVENMELT